MQRIILFLAFHTNILHSAAVYLLNKPVSQVILPRVFATADAAQGSDTLLTNMT